MRKEIADKWVAALRSGEYQQGTSLLCDGIGYCCLGVLCDLAVKDGAIAAPLITEDGHHVYDGKKSWLGTVVREWSGMGSDEGDLPKEYDSRIRLTMLNDKSRYTFAQIADVIEAEWEAL